MKNRNTLLLDAIARLLFKQEYAAMGAALVKIHGKPRIIFAVNRYFTISDDKFDYANFTQIRKEKEAIFRYHLNIRMSRIRQLILKIQETRNLDYLKAFMKTITLEKNGRYYQSDQQQLKMDLISICKLTLIGEAHDDMAQALQALLLQDGAVFVLNTVNNLHVEMEFRNLTIACQDDDFELLDMGFDMKPCLPCETQLMEDGLEKSRDFSESHGIEYKWLKPDLALYFQIQTGKQEAVKKTMFEAFSIPEMNHILITTASIYECFKNAKGHFVQTTDELTFKLHPFERINLKEVSQSKIVFKNPFKQNFSYCNEKIKNEIMDESSHYNALHFFASTGQTMEAKVLLDLFSAEPEMQKIFLLYQNKDGFNALISASRGGHLEIVQLLIKTAKTIWHDNEPEFKAWLNFQNKKGYTALHNACVIQHLPIMTLLYAEGCDPTITNKYGHNFVERLEKFGLLQPKQPTKPKPRPMPKPRQSPPSNQSEQWESQDSGGFSYDESADGGWGIPKPSPSMLVQYGQGVSHRSGGLFDDESACWSWSGNNSIDKKSRYTTGAW